MDRLPRPFIACGLGLLVMASGCRSTRPEVPPGRPFTKEGQQRKAIEFSSEGHPVSASASSNFMPSNLGGSNLASGIGTGGARANGSAFGAPPAQYGAPGTSGMGMPPVPSDPATERASVAPAEMPPAGLPRMDAPPVMDPPPAVSPTAPDLNVSPPPQVGGSAPNQVIQGVMDAPGTMGRPDQLPSSN